MTLTEQLNELHKAHAGFERIDAAILLRVLDSIVMKIAQQQTHADELGQTVGHVLTKLEAKADKVPYGSAR